MENRLPWQQQLWSLLRIVICVLYYSTHLSAQNFTLNYTGPDTLFVGNNCTTILDWGHPSSVNFTEENGNEIDTFFVQMISGGFQIGDTISAPSSVSVSYYVEDTTGANQILEAVLQIVVADSIAPFISQHAIDASISLSDTSNAFSAWLAGHGNATAMDECSIIDNGETSANWSIFRIDTMVTCEKNTTYAVTFQVADDSGNKDTTHANFFVIDTLAVDVNGLFVDRTDLCDGIIGQKLEQWFISIGNYISRDPDSLNLDFIEINFTDRDGFMGTWKGIGIPFSSSFIPTNDCQWYLDAEIIVQDTCGNILQDSARFAHIDTIQPMLELGAIPADTTVACGQIPIADSIIQATDNCDIDLTVTVQETADTLLSTIIIKRTWIVTDDCANSISGTQVITILDTIAPILVVIPADTIVDCGNIPPSPNDIVVSDNCTDTADLVFHFFETSDQLKHPDSCQAYNYSITRTWTVTDAFNNADTGIQVITVMDTLAPTFLVPADTMISCELRDSMTITGFPTNLNDNCDTLPDVSFVDLVKGGDCVEGGVLDTIIRTWTLIDACGNSTDQTQFIYLIDTTAPIISGLIADVTVQCNGGTVALPVIGTDITATDNCTGSPIIQYLGETTTQGNNPDGCDFFNYIISRTWRATDACGNADELVQTISIVDTVAPSIICPIAVIAESDSSICETMITLPKPFYFDDCTGIKGQDSLFLTQNFTNSTLGDVNEVPVDTMVFNFNIGERAPEKTIKSDLLLTVNLNGVDGEGSNEIFSIIGEDKFVFAGTNSTINQCGNSLTTISIPAAMANEYARDSLISIRLAPNGSGSNAINNICAGGHANLTLVYDFEVPSKSISLSYRLEGDMLTDFDTNPTTSFSVGDHRIMYYATDCSGNVDSCVFQLKVIDKIAPTFVCPDRMMSYTDSSNCEAEVLLPFPTNIQDNCGEFLNYNQTIAEFISFQNDSIFGQIPIARIDTFSVNSPDAIGPAILTVTFLGDNKDGGEFFNIFSENQAFLGFTSLGDTISECTNEITSVYQISQDSINAWAEDGEILISVFPNLDTDNFSDFINPCDTNLNTNLSDGSSFLSINLNFPRVIVDYTIEDSNEHLIDAGMLRSPNIPVSANLGAGTHRVTYRISDAAENIAACVYIIEVKDTLAPIIACRNDYVVQTNPSGLMTNLDLLADSLIANSSDNCGIDSILITPSQVSCTDTGRITITITAVDSAGNRATCQTDITIGIETLEPTFSVGVCNNDALFLFADTIFQTPLAPNTTFSYNWVGPNNFSSNEARPVIQNVGSSNSGIYTLTMTGQSGCTAMGSVFVNINNIDVPLLTTPSNTVCTSDGITLTTTVANCTNIEYQWYEILTRAAPLQDTVIQVGTAIAPTFTIEDPTAGRHAYYLVVQCDDCTSLGSEIVNITVFEVPTAVTGAEIINICEGENIVLSSPLTDQSCTYQWVGPGFIADIPTPSPITNAVEANEGVYTLTVSKNGCTSEEAFTVVNVAKRPAKPNIANDSGTIICEGSPILIRTDLLNANTYNWTNTTTLATYTTTTPEFSLEAAKITDGGIWTVSVENAGCTSLPSDALTIQVEAKPTGTPFFEGAACEGRTINLNVNPIVAGAAYEWSDADGNLFFGTNPIVPAKSPYTLSISSPNGCVTKEILAVNVKTTPVITALFDSGTADPCIVPGETDLRIIADVFPANNGTYFYTWRKPDGTQLPPMLDSMLLIPNTTASDANGTYTLVVNTGDGCMSDPVANIVNVSDIPVPNPVISASSSTLCEGQSLTLRATEYPNIAAEYRWLVTSIMDTITQSPILVFDSITTAFNGQVTLQVYNGACPSISTATLAINVNPPLAQPTINSSSTFCTGELLSLSTLEVPNATYLWEGPNFSATSSTPEIVVAANADLENNGGYLVQILSNGCTSPKSAPIIASVSDVPVAPIIDNSGDVCLPNASELILFIDQENTPIGAEFRWYNATTNELIAGPNTDKSQIIATNTLGEGTYQFYATQTVNGCESPISTITEITLAEIPTELAQICNGNRTICDASQATICALEPTQGKGTWTSNDTSIIINNPNLPETTISGLVPGSTYTFFWTLSNEVCGEYSATRLIVDVGLTATIANVCHPLIEICDNSPVNLCANPVPAGFEGRWSQPISQEDLGVIIDNSAASNTAVSKIEPGNPSNIYTFYWTVIDDQGVCSASDTVTVKVFGIPDEQANIPDEELISCNEDAVITANSLTDGLIGTWTSLREGVIIDAPNNASTSIGNLSPGMNTLVWSITAGACVDYSTDELIVFYEEAPQAMDDAFDDIGFSSSATLNVVENDQVFSPEFEINILSDPMNGTANVEENGQINYVPNQNFIGKDLITYELCNATCTSDCSIAQISLDVGKSAPCTIPTIMTPNGDGINDAFLIPCVDTGNFPGNEVIIYNQWGDEIYRAAPYRNDWEGTYNGEDIPTGTYYYVVSFDKNDAPKAGFLIIER